MGKKAITITMTVTVVLALFLFGSIVALRPGAEEGFLSEFFPEPHEPVVEKAEIDPADILDAIRGSEELKGIVRTEVAEKINDIALEGAEVDVDLLKDTILREVSDVIIESELQAMEALEKESDELRAENDALRASLEDLRREVEALQARDTADEGDIVSMRDSLRAEVNALVDERTEEIKKFFASSDRAVYDSVVDELVLLEDDIYAYIDAELAALPAAEAAAPSPAVSEEEIVRIFADSILEASRRNSGDTVYDEIVYNVASDVMATLAQEDSKTFGELSGYRESSYDVIELIVNEILDRLASYEDTAVMTVEPVEEVIEEPVEEVIEEPVEEVIEEPVVEEVVEEPVEELVEEPVVEEVVEEPVVEEVVEEPVVEEPVEEPVVEEPVEEPVVEEPASPKVPLLSRPGFSFDNARIEGTREEARDAAISGVIDALRKANEN